jgi:hypothetical protein
MQFQAYSVSCPSARPLHDMDLLHVFHPIGIMPSCIIVAQLVFAGIQNQPKAIFFLGQQLLETTGCND